MKKYLTAFCGALIFTGAANAVEYIQSPMTVSPANESMLSGMGLIDIQWQGETLDVLNDDTSAKNNIDFSYLDVAINGEPNEAWKTYMGSEFYAHHIEYSNEQSGGQQVTDGGYLLTLYLGTMSFFWQGEINITIKEGAVKNKQGAINPEISLTYYVKQPVDYTDISFQPSNHSEFKQGEGKITVSWNKEGEISLNSSKAKGISAIKLDGQGGPGDTYSLADYSSIENNTLVIGLQTLPTGNYFLLIPEAAVFIGNEYINLESIDYDFKITGEESNSITSILSPELQDKSIYDLQGRKINDGDVKAGIYIIDGKKVMVK